MDAEKPTLTKLLALAALVLTAQRAHDRCNNVTPAQLLPSYDFVVVGGGTGGAVVASRLSERDVSVLLVEAGPPSGVINDMPAMAAKLIGSEQDWNVTSEPQTGACGGTRCRYSRGRVLGGSSAINGMTWMAGDYRDFDRWQRVYGADGWGWQQVAPYFVQSEHFEGANPGRGLGGPIGVSMPSPNDVVTAWMQGAVKAGIVPRDLYANGTGVSLAPKAIRNGVRQSTSVAYLQPHALRPNLHVLTSATATNLVFENQNAKRVRLVVEGVEREVAVNREVVLSAGAFNTPQLLMLSGIGPRDLLSQLNIPLIADLPVGETLQDHVAFPAFSLKSLTPAAPPVEPLTLDSLYSYFLSGSGPLARSPAAITAVASPLSRSPAHPDLHIAMFGHGTALVFLMRPKSVGTVRIGSRSAFSAPLVDPALLGHRDDQQTLMWGVREAWRIGRSVSGFTPQHTPNAACPLCSTGSFLDAEGLPCPEYLTCALRNASPGWHPSSTTPIGTVLDVRLRVKGIGHLRVADASVFPELISAPTSAAVVMVAERAAQMLAEDHGLALG